MASEEPGVGLVKLVKPLKRALPVERTEGGEIPCGVGGCNQSFGRPGDWR
jgi:hypothetical protein